MGCRRLTSVIVLTLLVGEIVWANGVDLELSGEKVALGDVQKLTVEFQEAGIYDVYLILSGEGGRFHCLKPDGSFSPARKSIPYLKGLRVSKAGKLVLHSWRVTGLEYSTYAWSVVLTAPGKNLIQKENRLGLDTSRFAVAKESKTAAYDELAEGGGPGGRGAEGAVVGRARSVRYSGMAGGDGAAVEKGKKAEPAAAGELGDLEAETGAPAPARSAVTPAAPPADAPADAAEPVADRHEALRKAADKKPEALTPLKDEAGDGRNAIAQIQALTAGESDDNREFQMYLEFLQSRNSPQVMAMDVSQRRFITVLDAQGRHVPNADVEVRIGEALVYAGRTYANGQTLFFPSAVPELTGKQTLRVSVRKGVLEAQYEYAFEIVKDEKLKNQFDPASLPKPTPPGEMPHPVIPIYRGELLEKDRHALAAAAKRAAVVDEAQAPTIQKLDWLEDSGDSGGEQPVEPIERAPAAPAGDWILRLPAAVEPVRPQIDIVFQIDTTGSMHDEIRSIQATLDSVAARIDAMDPRPIVRWGLVLYGDKGDAYTVRRYAFTGDVKEFRDWVVKAQLTSGGDTPEAALEGLNAAVSEMGWNTGDAIRLIFLIADAPPHLDYGRPYTYIDKMKEAIAKGIKIYPTAASGLNKQGEYIFRQWAQATLAKFLFITYGAGTPAGGPAGKTPHEVKQPGERNNLDDIIVKVVGAELKNWTTPAFYGEAAPAEGLKVVVPVDEEMELF